VAEYNHIGDDDTYCVFFLFNGGMAIWVTNLAVIGQRLNTVLTGSTFQRLSVMTSVGGFVAFSPFEEEPSEGLQRKLLCKIKKLVLLEKGASPSYRYASINIYMQL